MFIYGPLPGPHFPRSAVHGSANALEAEFEGDSAEGLRPRPLAAGDHRLDFFLGELHQDVPQAGAGLRQQPHHELAFLLEEEDVARLLLVDVRADDPQRRFVETAGLALGAAGGCGARPWRRATASSISRAMSSSRR